MDERPRSLEDAWRLLLLHYNEPRPPPQRVADAIADAIAVAERSPWACAEPVVKAVERAIDAASPRKCSAQDWELRAHLRRFAARARRSHLHARARFDDTGLSEYQALGRVTRSKAR